MCFSNQHTVSRADMSVLLHLDFELLTSKTKQNTPHTGKKKTQKTARLTWRYLCSLFMRLEIHSFVKLFENDSSCVFICLCGCWFLLTDKQTTDVVLEKVKVAWVILKWAGWEASPRRYSNGGVIFNFGSIKQDVQPSLPRYLIKYFTHYISFVLPAAGSEW